MIHHDNFTRLYVPYKISTRRIKRAGFAGKNDCVPYFSHAKRAKAVWISCRDQFSGAHHKQGIRAVDLADRTPNRLFNTVTVNAFPCNDIRDHLRVDRRLKNCAPVFQLLADFNSVCQIAVMRNCQNALNIAHDKRLRIFPHAAASC